MEVMENRLSILELKVTGLEKLKDDFSEIKTNIIKMEMTDKNIFEKLNSINENVKLHKDNFVSHDEKEMEKYGTIDKRLQKLERVMYIGIGVGLTIEILSKFHLLTIGN